MIPSIPGVYAIVNVKTGCRYIGHTRNLRQRAATHWALLRKGRHHNTRLQADWSKRGEKEFAFSILALVPESATHCIEKRLIAAHLGKDCYNWSESGSTGRPVLAHDDRLMQRSIRLSQEQWAKIDAAGIGWLRGVINRAKAPATPEETAAASPVPPAPPAGPGARA